MVPPALGPDAHDREDLEHQVGHHEHGRGHHEQRPPRTHGPEDVRDLAPRRGGVGAHGEGGDHGPRHDPRDHRGGDGQSDEEGVERLRKVERAPAHGQGHGEVPAPAVHRGPVLGRDLDADHQRRPDEAHQHPHLQE